MVATTPSSAFLPSRYGEYEDDDGENDDEGGASYYDDDGGDPSLPPRHRPPLHPAPLMLPPHLEDPDLLVAAPQPAVCLEGVLQCRKGRSAGGGGMRQPSLLWKRRFVHLDLVDGGSITVYKEDRPQLLLASASAARRVSIPTTSALRSVYTKLHEFGSSMSLLPNNNAGVVGAAAAAGGMGGTADGSDSCNEDDVEDDDDGDDDGSEARDKPVDTNSSGASTKKARGDGSRGRSPKGTATTTTSASEVIEMHIPAHIPWIVKDVQNDTSNFVVEIPTSAAANDDVGNVSPLSTPAKGDGENDAASSFSSGTGNGRNKKSFGRVAGDSFDDGGSDDGLYGEYGSVINKPIDEEGEEECEEEKRPNRQQEKQQDGSEQESDPRKRLEYEFVDGLDKQQNGEGAEHNQASAALTPLLGDGMLENARNKGKSVLRVYFRCSKGRSEKALWLQAFARLNRLSDEVRRKKGLLSSLATPLQYGMLQARTRRLSNTNIARDIRQLELFSSGPNGDEMDTESVDLLTYSCNDVEELVRGNNGDVNTDSKLRSDKEFRVQPTYAYPHRWMTRQEMREEMILPSETFHDLRVPGNEKKEVGSLRVEVLQCLGLPKLDRTALTDAIVYLVCGSYAFATDVIPNRANPMWLRKTRRACEFPLYHAYARLYAGVFDDDKKKTKDEFAGRVVVDLARLRPCSSYDVTLPLRLSTSVYSTRRRGAIRLRFTVRWTTERDALMSYIPKKVNIPLPQHTSPNVDTTVLCADQKAFRNVAITVHGAHLPGKFTFQEMRAAIREINYTRKYIFTAIRKWFRETRHWQYPTISAFIFVSWMHCIYANQFSLVPAYLVLYFFIQLMSNYAKYGIDGPCNKEFVPPSWEELLMALTRGGDPDYHAIEPLDMGLRPLSLARRRTADSADGSFDDLDAFDYRVSTHHPRGKALFRGLGFMDDIDSLDTHLEFPFANGVDYPRVTVKNSLVPRKGESNKGDVLDNQSLDGSVAASFQVGDNSSSSVQRHHEDARALPRLALDLDMSDLMRRDSSGLRERDEEEENFAARRAVMFSGKKAASTITKTATELTGRSISTISKTATGFTEAAGLHHVVSPIAHGISSGVSMGVSGVSSGLSGVSSGVSHVSDAVHTMVDPVSKTGRTMLNRTGRTFKRSISHPTSSSKNSGHPAEFRSGSDNRDQKSKRGLLPSSSLPVRAIATSAPATLETKLSEVEPLGEPNDRPEEIDPLLIFPQQNVDVEGPSTGKKLTEDLDEIKDKIHEMTWNLFNDRLYVVRHPDACYFGQAKKSEKRRKATGASKDLDKLMRVKQYSHPNPFVARVGLYVEPIIGSVYSFLCAFRAGFNVMTWRDPMLTFWVSVFSGSLAVILFVFPWRIFLFVTGIFLVGPQNWIFRILREKGHLPPLPPPRRRNKKSDEDLFEDGLPSDQPVFTVAKDQQGRSNKRQNGKAAGASKNDKDSDNPINSEFDPREVHRVVVPYSPLMYQRFYDWPPEPQYAQVKRVDGGIGNSNNNNNGPGGAGRVLPPLPMRRVASAASSAAGQQILIPGLSTSGSHDEYLASSSSVAPSSTTSFLRRRFNSGTSYTSNHNSNNNGYFNRSRTSTAAAAVTASSSSGLIATPPSAANRKRSHTGDWQGGGGGGVGGQQRY